MSAHVTPASARAASAAATPYSTKLRPHLPHGCIPTPRTATSVLIARSSRLTWRVLSAVRSTRSLRAPSDRLPLPHQVFVLVVLVERAHDELDLVAGVQRRQVHAGHQLAEHDHPLGRQLDGDDHVGLERVGGDVRGWRLVAVVREGPDPAPP